MQQDPAPSTNGPYIPPPAEVPAARVPRAEVPAARVPRAEDFPPVAQRQLAAQRAGDGPPPQEDRGPLSLLRRLAAVGLGRRDDGGMGAGSPAKPSPRQGHGRPAEPSQASGQPPQSQPVQPAPRAQPQLRPAPQQGPGYQPQRGELDQHGRSLPREVRPHDDELDIPAFLRRQSN